MSENVTSFLGRNLFRGENPHNFCHSL